MPRTNVRASLLGISVLLASLFALSYAKEAQNGKDVLPNPFNAKVTRVTDGDTIIVSFDRTEYEIRLETIDAPERNQPFGQKAKEVLTEKIAGKEVKVVWNRKDKFKRIVGRAFLEGRPLCVEMVTHGYAWDYSQYSKAYPDLAKALTKAEKEAKAAKRGLWADANPIPPWEFRKKKGNHESEDPAKECVYVTPGGKKYHIKDCRYLKTNPSEVTLEKAIQRKLDPCAVCRPPVAKPKE